MADKSPRPATSEDIPRAVEFLINFVLRGAFLMLAAGAAFLGFIAWLSAWPWWPIPLILSFLLFILAFAFRPRGKLVFDRAGPSVVVPKRPE